MEGNTNSSRCQCGHTRRNLRWSTPCRDRPNCTVVDKDVFIGRKCNTCKKGDAIRKEQALADKGAETAKEKTEAVEGSLEAVSDPEAVKESDRVAH